MRKEERESVSGWAFQLTLLLLLLSRRGLFRKEPKSGSRDATRPTNTDPSRSIACQTTVQLRRACSTLFR